MVFQSRRVDATRERDVPERYPNRIEFSEVSFGEVSVDVRLGRRLDCLARGRRGRGRTRASVRSSLERDDDGDDGEEGGGGAHAPSLDPAVARAFEAYDHAFTVCDATRPDCPIVYASDGFMRLTQYEAEEVIGHNCRFLQGEKTNEDHVREVREATRRGDRLSVRLLNYKKMERRFGIISSSRP